MDDEMHFCWEQCCDQGPHSCICGNDCDPTRPEPHTPTTEQVLAAYVLEALQEANAVFFGGVDPYDDFQRWLAGVRAEARAEALREAADQVLVSEWWVPQDNAASRVRRWLRERADQEEEQR